MLRQLIQSEIQPKGMCLRSLNVVQKCLCSFLCVHSTFTHTHTHTLTHTSTHHACQSLYVARSISFSSTLYLSMYLSLCLSFCSVILPVLTSPFCVAACWTNLAINTKKKLKKKNNSKILQFFIAPLFEFNASHAFVSRLWI